MDNSHLPWHLIPGNKELQVEAVIKEVKARLNGESKKLNIGSQGFGSDEKAGLEFVEVITKKLLKLGLKGSHDLHQSKNGSGNWYYFLRGIMPIESDFIFTTYKEARDVAMEKKGMVKRDGDNWRVTM
ncbi:hypothetical protein AB4140_08905 [Shewanella sp. 10N.286.51.B2]|uniref:hypothetical protein n=1 Tax=Shewanella sp. 10N.286.51.B2 TaxID=3229707 RepID=UPI003551E913